MLLYASRAVTVSVWAWPAVSSSGTPIPTEVLAAAGLTVMPACVPVMLPVTVSVAVIDRRAGRLERDAEGVRALVAGA